MEMQTTIVVDNLTSHGAGVNSKVQASFIGTNKGLYKGAEASLCKHIGITIQFLFLH